MSHRSVPAIFLFCSFVPLGFAQQNAQSSTNRRITLEVVVSDKSGKPIPDLQQQDFTLEDNKQPQKIVSFEAVHSLAPPADKPVEAVLIVDEVNTSFTRVAYERGEIEKFLQRDGAQLALPVSLVFLTDTGTAIGSQSTRDGNALVAELKENKSGLRTVTRSQGVYGADDRVQISLHGLQQLADYEATRPGRKLVIWISPGWPFLSGPRIELNSKQQDAIFHSVVDLSDRLPKAGITLYSIDPLGTADAGGFRTSYYNTFVKGVKKPSQVQIGNLGLQVLATQSGGRVLNSSNDIASEIAICISDVSAYYVLTFDGLPGDGPNEYHSLDVKIDKPGLTARTRTGYYAQP